MLNIMNSEISQIVMTVVDLLAQIADVDVNDIGAVGGVKLPEIVLDLLPGDHKPLVPDKIQEQLEFLCRERDRQTGTGNRVVVAVDDQIAAAQEVLPCLDLPAQHDAQTCQELVKIEGLCNVVVRAEIKPADDVLGGIPCRQEENGRLDALAPDPFKHRKAVHSGQHDIQNGAIIAAKGQIGICVLAVEAGIGHITVGGKLLADDLVQILFVFYHQELHDAATPEMSSAITDVPIG